MARSHGAITDRPQHDLLVDMPMVGRHHDDIAHALNELRNFPVPVDITVIDRANIYEEASVPDVVRLA